MKCRSKTSTANKRGSSKIKLAKKEVKLISKKTSKLRHFKIVEHKHTGKLLHHKHTSHLSLFVTLFFIGIFILTNHEIARAITVDGGVSVGVIVVGPPPSEGAAITIPDDTIEIVDQNIFEISGTCQVGTFVVVTNNELAVSSIMCSSDGKFNITIQLSKGLNSISALNYDNYNQPGPITPSVVIRNLSPDLDEEVVEPIIPNIPDNPSIIPGIPTGPQSCDEYKFDSLPYAKNPHVSIVCVPRIFNPNTNQTMGILIWGGMQPYAINVNWGSRTIDDTLLSLSEPTYITIPFSYEDSGMYQISIRAKDSSGVEAITQTAVLVNGTTVTSNIKPTNPVAESQKPWIVQPVPLYFLAVAITFGFWIGDIFVRRFVEDRPPKHRLKTA